MENTIFKCKSGYILLEDLQSQFSNGLIPPDDQVQVFTNGSRTCVTLKIVDAIKRFSGPDQSQPSSEEPSPIQEENRPAVKPTAPFLSNSLFTSSRSFKRGEDTRRKNQEEDGPSASTPEVRKPREKSKLNSMLLLKLMNQKRLKGYPLFNFSQEPEEEWITGQDVIDELGKLETLLTENPNQSTQTEYFQTIEKIHGKVTCSSCNFEKKSIEEALVHLFSEEHKKKLSESNISKNSFKFWIDHIEECKKLDEEQPRVVTRRVTEPETEEEEEEEEEECFTGYGDPHWRRNRYLFPGQVRPVNRPHPWLSLLTERIVRQRETEKFHKPFPLLYSNIDDKPLELEDSHIALLAELFSKLTPANVQIEAAYLGRFFKGRTGSYSGMLHPKYCETCNCFVTKSDWKITKHVLSKRHLMSLESVSLDDYNFWLYAMRASVRKGRINYTVTLNYISPNKLDAFNRPENVARKVPLLDVPRSQYGHISKRQYIRRHEAIRVRLASAKLNRKKKIPEVKYVCYHCPGTPKLSTMWEVIEHVFNDEHCANISYLAYPHDFIYYENLINEYTLPTSRRLNNYLSKCGNKYIYE